MHTLSPRFRLVLVVMLFLTIAIDGKAAEPNPFLGLVEKSFKSWDKNRDGELSNNELDVAVANPKITGKTAAALAALKRTARSTKLKPPTLSLANIRQIATNAPAADKPDFLRMFNEGWSRLTNAPNRDLFATGRPQLATVHQGKLGNCFCLAPLGAMLNRDPAQVAEMFSREKDGTYRVTFGNTSVCIKPPTDSEIAMTSSNERDGIWINIYEKAIGEAQNLGRPAPLRMGSPLDALAKGGSAGTMLKFITGHEITRFGFAFAKDAKVSSEEREEKLRDLRSQLKVAAGQKRLMTCGTIKTTTPGVTPNHAYAILDYDEGTDAVKLWNPHGGSFKPKGAPNLENGYPQKDGVFMMPVGDFVQQFSGMAFEVTQIAAN